MTIVRMLGVVHLVVFAHGIGTFMVMTHIGSIPGASIVANPGGPSSFFRGWSRAASYDS
jgi:hypothetical protein